jgi:hypothetical protein
MNFILQTVNQFFIHSSNFIPSFGSNPHHIANLSCTFTTHNNNVIRALKGLVEGRVKRCTYRTKNKKITALLEFDQRIILRKQQKISVNGLD